MAIRYSHDRGGTYYVLTVPVERMNEIAEHPAQTGTTDFHPEGYDVCFKNVAFSYEQDKTVLNDVSFTAKQGEVTALVGPSGGGKTTVSRLAARFWMSKAAESRLAERISHRSTRKRCWEFFLSCFRM